MKPIRILICAGCLVAGAAAAQTPVTLSVDTRAPGRLIPPDFVGLSFETESLQYDSPRVDGYLFDSTNTQLLTLFKNLEIKNLRIGGTSVDTNHAGYFPARKDIDALFRFARAADVKVIYSLRLMNGDPARDAAAAKYVWENHKSRLAAFAIGNEPNLYKDRDPEITNDVSFFDKWQRFAAVIRNAVPGAGFGGPDTGTGGTRWAAYFAAHEAGSPMVTCIYSHYYVGGNPKNKSARWLIDHMLSPAWVNRRYPAYYGRIGAKALALGFPYRLTEINSYVAPFPGVQGGNNSYATALFVVDCMHWWAVHQCAGLNFHTVVGKYNGTIYRDANGNYQVYPMAYGIKAFDVGGHGRTAPVAISNRQNLDLTAYAVIATNRDLFITIVNKEHGSAARDARVNIVAKGIPAGKASAMFLRAPHGNVGATQGVTFGGSPIANDVPWRGEWTALGSMTNGSCAVVVPSASVAVVRFAAR